MITQYEYGLWLIGMIRYEMCEFSFASLAPGMHDQEEKIPILKQFGVLDMRKNGER